MGGKVYQSFIDLGWIYSEFFKRPFSIISNTIYPWQLKINLYRPLFQTIATSVVVSVLAGWPAHSGWGARKFDLIKCLWLLPALSQIVRMLIHCHLFSDLVKYTWIFANLLHQECTWQKRHRYVPILLLVPDQTTPVLLLSNVFPAA